MSDSVTHLIGRARTGDADAAQKLWEFYSQRLAALARKGLEPGERRIADEEDIANMALATFFRRARDGNFSRLNDRADLWRLLARITSNKLAHHRAYLQAEKRGGGKMRGESALEKTGDPRSVDTRADIYSFGATFYHALTGKLPFDGQSSFSILFKHKTEKPISPRVLRPELTERISTVVERCLAKAPADRFASFADVLKHLQPPPKHPDTLSFVMGGVVLCRWKGGQNYFRGKITGFEGPRIHIDYDDGDKEWTTANLILALGTIVQCRWKGGQRYFRGKITGFDKNRIHIDYDDGDKEWTTGDMVQK